jgi:hypothetical protein
LLDFFWRPPGFATVLGQIPIGSWRWNPKEADSLTGMTERKTKARTKAKATTTAEADPSLRSGDSPLRQGLTDEKSKGNSKK